MSVVRASMVLPILIALGACRLAMPLPTGVVLIDEKSLNRTIAVENVASSPTETGTQKVWAGIRNKTNARVAIEARAVFRGERGEPIEPDAGWRQIFIEPQSTTAFEAMSMSRNARHFTVEIRAGNQ